MSPIEKKYTIVVLIVGLILGTLLGLSTYLLSQNVS